MSHTHTAHINAVRSTRNAAAADARRHWARHAKTREMCVSGMYLQHVECSQVTNLNVFIY